MDVIKLDRTFTAELGRTPGADTIPATIIHLARGLSLVAIAEGVESRDQVERLIALGFRIGQRYLFGHARPGNEWPRSVRDRSGSGSGSGSQANLRANQCLLSRAPVASPISHGTG